MEDLKKIINDIDWNRLTDAVISNKKNNASEIFKVKLRPVKIKETFCIQVTEYIDKKVIHTNKSEEELKEYIFDILSNDFKQAVIETSVCNYNILISKKGHVTVKKKQVEERKQPVLMHNRTKKYLLPEGVPVDFLISLNVMNKDGFVLKTKYDKFRQINRFLEFVDDIVPCHLLLP